MRSLAPVIVGIASVAGVVSAQAADPPRKKYPRARVIHTVPAPPPPVDIYVPASGWYVRGDLGHRWHTVSNVGVASGFLAPDDHRVSSGWFGGLGFGFKQDWLRVDVTADYGSRVTYRGTVATADDVTAKFQANTALLNFYYEPYNFNGFIPYIGIGAGVAHVRLSDFSSTAIPPFTPVGASKKFNMAYAVMIGSSFAMSRRMLFDIGYRYLALGTVDTTADSSGRVASFKDFTAHEIRIGLRYMFTVDPPNLR